MKNMFCYQCEQTVKGTGCTVSGICGKKPDTAKEQDVLTCEMITLASVMQKSGQDDTDVVDGIVDGLFMTVTNVNFDAESIARLSSQIHQKWKKGAEKPAIKPDELFQGDENFVSLRSTLLEAANTGANGNPFPTKVPLTIE